jgi:hypothetical protein
MLNITIIMSAIACTLALTACGGGGGDNNGGSVSSRADEGIWSSLDNVTSATGLGMQAVILSDGSYWGIYGFVSPCQQQGVVQGIASVDGSNVSGTYTNFPSGNIGPFKGTYTGTVSARNHLNLTFNDPSNATALNPIAVGNMSYDSTYNQPASLTAIVGNYTNGVGCINSSWYPISLPVLTISGSNLTLLGADGSTVMQGTIAPHGKVNVFDVSLTTASTGELFAQYGTNNAPIPAGTTYKGILFQTSSGSLKNYVEIITTSGNSAFSYIGGK